MYENIRTKLKSLDLPPRIKIELLEAVNKDNQAYNDNIKNDGATKTVNEIKVDETVSNEIEKYRNEAEKQNNINSDILKMIEESNIRK